MDQITYNQIIDQLYKDRRKTVEDRGTEYANEDTLASFKRVGAIMTLLDVDNLDWQQKHHINMIVMKLDRLVNQLKSPKDRLKIEDTFADLLNYIELFYAADIENNLPP